MHLHRLRWTDSFPQALRHGAVTFGNFDGVHRGHVHLIQVLKRWAVRQAGPAVAITFDPPPVALLNPAAWAAPLTTLPQRAELLHAAGADHVVALQTDASLLALSAPAFIEEVVQKQLDARAIVEGSNFRFGRNREGTIAYLNTLEYRANINFEEVPVDAVNSSRVRAAVNAGDVATASDLLGRPYSIAGTVVAGAKRGRTLGVPTANLGHVTTLVPAVGVYAGSAQVAGQWQPAAINIGPNPTFGDDARKIEVHIIDYDGDLYGDVLAVRFTQRLRETRPFNTLDELKAQLATDIAMAKAVAS
jgi:riboflavin kinase/FMN adenylyltransferase